MDEGLRRALDRLSRDSRVLAVILFGSRARGDYGPWSDYDLLVIGEFGSPYLERIGELLEELPDDVPVEPHPYTPEEAERMLRKGNPLLIDALLEGVVLLDRGVVGRLREVLEDMLRRGLRRTETSYVLPKS